MVWGTSLGSRHAHSPDPDLVEAVSNLPPPVTAQCANCESWVVLAGGKLPPGWVLIEGQALCKDCAPPPRGALRERIGRAAPRMSATALRPIGEPADCGRYRGCRIGHEIAFGQAVLQIRAGASPPEGRDEAVQFLVDAHAIDELIIELAAIRDQVLKQDPRR